MNAPGSAFGAARPHQLAWAPRRAQLDRAAYHADHCQPCARALRRAHAVRRAALPLAVALAVLWPGPPLGLGLGLGVGRAAALFLAAGGVARWAAGGVAHLVGGAGATWSGELPRRSEAAAGK
jgi:hypothetical protein